MSSFLTNIPLSFIQFSFLFLLLFFVSSFISISGLNFSIVDVEYRRVSTLKFKTGERGKDRTSRSERCSKMLDDTVAELRVADASRGCILTGISVLRRINVVPSGRR